MCRTYQDHAYDSPPEPSDFQLTLLDQVLLKCGLPVGIGKFQLEGWRAPIPWYLFECEKHGLVTNYRWGHSQKLICPECHKERSNWRGGASRSNEKAEPGCLHKSLEDKEAPP